MMRTLVVSLVACCAFAQTAPLPVIRQNGAVKQLYVDGRPFVMLAGELHNSTPSSVAYMRSVWKKTAALNLNTVIGAASWELVEPREGQFDFKLVDEQIRLAREHNQRLVLIWFASWKNGVSSYAPLWVKTDLKRFPRMQTAKGTNKDVLTPLAETTMRADAKAYAALMRHIREVDPRHTVVMMQVQNEIGLRPESRDRCALADAAWNKPVPDALMRHLIARKDRLMPELTAVWSKSNFRAAGTWAEVFGEGAHADEVFMAWHMARYVEFVTAAGKAELKLPMYANAWLVQSADQLPGGYPSGGPVSRVMDVWQAAAPSLDLLAPDIYLPDFKGVCESYVRGGNTLFIPEARASVPNLMWAIGRHATLGFAPFGIDSLEAHHPLKDAYAALQGMMPQLVRAQAEGKVAVVVQDNAEQRTASVSLGGYRFNANYGVIRWVQPGVQAVDQTPIKGVDDRAYALIVNIAPDEFVVVGSRVALRFGTDSPGPRVAGIGAIDEGRYENGVWIAGRRLNGDENAGGTQMLLYGPGLSVQRVKLYRHD